MIINTQMGGEGNWFWHAVVFGNGVHLYSGLHSPLQPLFVLENSAWIALFGIKTYATQSLSVIHLVLLILGIRLVVNETQWSDAGRALLLFTVFVITVYGHEYRFDDYHILDESLILYALYATLRLLGTQSARGNVAISSVLGLLCGATITTRITDGVALSATVAFCLLVLLQRRRLLGVALFLLAGALTVLLVVHLTGDSFRLYLQSTLFKAAASKGGTGNVLAAPFRTVLSLPGSLHFYARRATLFLLAFAALLLLTKRFLPRGRVLLPLGLVGLAALSYLAAPADRRAVILKGNFADAILLYFIVALYAIGVVVVVRLLLSRTKLVRWKRREVIYLIPIAIWLSYTASSSAQVLLGFYLPVALTLLLVAVFQPRQLSKPWVKTAFFSVLACFAVTATAAEIYVPYAWLNYTSSPMFTHRTWYRHPVYGPIYVDDDLLAFSKRVCRDIQSGPGSKPELLSLPYPYPNYFCATPPWHNYVQTFFDTSTRPVIEGLIHELDTDPPQWIVYQRQLLVMVGTEHWYQHDQPLPHRALDTLIFSKIASGQWVLVDYSDYLGHENGGWYVIRTR